MLGQGVSCATKNDVIGIIKYIESPADVIKIIKEGNPKDKICLLTQAGATTLAPIFNKIAGVLCTSGGRGSHLAIMSREFGIPAYMGCKFELSLEDLNDKKVLLVTEQNERDGTILEII